MKLQKFLAGALVVSTLAGCGSDPKKEMKVGKSKLSASQKQTKS